MKQIIITAMMLLTCMLNASAQEQTKLDKMFNELKPLIQKGIKREDLLLIHDILQASTDATSKPDSSQPTKG